MKAEIVNAFSRGYDEGFAYAKKNMVEKSLIEDIMAEIRTMSVKEPSNKAYDRVYQLIGLYTGCK